MAGYGVGNFGEAFVGGFTAGERVKAMRAETKRQDELNTRQQTEFDRKEGDIQQLRALGDQIVQMNSEWVGMQSGQQQPPEQGVGPPAPDGTPAPAPQRGVALPGQQAPAKPMTYMEALKDTQAHMAKMAPLYAKVYMLADPKEGAKYVQGLGDAKLQNLISEEVAVGRLLLTNPNSSEARDAFTQFYERVPDGRKVMPETYEVLGNGAIKFRTANNDGSDVRPEVIEPARIRAMTMRGLSPDKLASELRQDDEQKSKDALRKEQIDNYKRDDTRREQEFKETSRLRGEQIAATREGRQALSESRTEQAKARERDEITRGIDGALGIGKDFSDRPEEEQRPRLGRRESALSLIDANPDRFKGKGGSVGARALAVGDSIAEGKARLLQDDAEPQNIIAEIGGVQYKLPASSYVVQQLVAGAKAKAGAAQAPNRLPRGVRDSQSRYVE